MREAINYVYLNIEYSLANLIIVIAFTIIFFAMFVWFNRFPTKKAHVALITFGGVPLLAYVLVTATFWFGNPIAVARTAFVYIVVLLPASLFFLFIATRKESAFNQYVVSLDRLGLLRARTIGPMNTPEDDLRLTRRVKSYLDRFSAVYGSIPDNTIRDFLDSVTNKSFLPSIGVGTQTGELFSSFELRTILPVLGASILIAFGWIMVLPPYPLPPLSPELGHVEHLYKDNSWYLWAAEPVLVPAAFAFLGAYFFSLQMLVRRFVRRDLGPNAYNAVSVRIILATLGVWVAAQWFNLLDYRSSSNSYAILFILSFAVGAFPIIVWQLVANALKRLSIAEIMLPNLQGTLPLSQIDGLSVWHEARLEEEDIENIHNLATADVVELILNTKIAPNRIIDWVDQAILLTTLPPVPRDDKSVWIGDELRNHAIRTASTLAAAADSQEGKSNAYPALPDSLRTQIQALAATARLNANFAAIWNWLSVDTDRVR